MRDPLTLSPSPTLQDSVSTRLVYAWLCQQGTERRPQGWSKFLFLRPLGFLPAMPFERYHFTPAAAAQSSLDYWTFTGPASLPPHTTLLEKSCTGPFKFPTQESDFQIQEAPSLSWDATSSCPVALSLGSQLSGASPNGIQVISLSWQAQPLHCSGFQLHGTSPCPNI